MKRFATAIIIILLIAFASCEPETMLTIDQTSISFTDAGGSQTVSLTANKPWTASSSQSWCKVSPSSGEEVSSSRITISCDANTTYDARNATITIACAELTKTVSITQATNNGLLVSQTTYELTKAAQQLNIEVQANVKLSVDVDNGCKDWVKYNSTKGLTTSTVVLDIAENKTFDSREGKVTIKQEGGNLLSTVTIKQSQVDGLFITTPEYNLSNEKHSLTIEVSTNVEFDVKPEADWVKYVETKGLSSKQIVLEVAENDTYDQRETKVNVKQKNGDLSGTVTIKQDEKYGILVTQPEYSLSNEAATIDVEVKYNVDFDVVIPDDCKAWIKQVSTKSLESKTYTFSIAKNETYDNREGSITFKQRNGSLSTTIAIKQAQTDIIMPEMNEYAVSYEQQILDIKVFANIDYQVQIDDGSKDWVALVQTKEMIESFITLAIEKNEGNTRNATVYVVGDNVTKEITIIQSPERELDYVDLGLSVKWATTNVGAIDSSDLGYLYAWGEVLPKTSFEMSNYIWYEYDYSGLVDVIKYNEKDRRTCLLPEDDVATVSYGNTWRIPTEYELWELFESCDWTYISSNARTGYLLVSRINGKSIFLPMVRGYYVKYGSSSLYGGAYSSVCSIGVTSDDYFKVISSRYDGYYIRPVYGDRVRVSGIQLDKTTITIREGYYDWITPTIIPQNAGEKNIMWSSSDPNVATIKEMGGGPIVESRMITGISPGTAIITASTVDGGFVSSCNVVVTEQYPIPEIVDMGVSVKWGSMNLGAINPEDYGDYFRWGEIESAKDWIPYTLDEKYESDRENTLNLGDDAANVLLGTEWRLPTKQEVEELCAVCSCEDGYLNGVKGWYLTSTITNNRIFLPAAGRLGWPSVGQDGYYWCSTIVNGDPQVWCADPSYIIGWWLGGGHNGSAPCSIRPVFQE